MSLGAAEPSGVRRAAVLIETTDGRRMLYEFDEHREITLDMHVKPGYEPEPWDPSDYWRNAPKVLTVEGEFKGGTVWTGDMPTAQPDTAAAPEISAAPIALEGREVHDLGD